MLRWVASLAAAASVLLIVPLEHVSAQVDSCIFRATFKNNTRRVPGAVNTECSWIHSPPWGNWGVDSGYSSRRDGYQFAGWKPRDGWRQWNSCTKNFHSSRHFNDGTGQRANPDNAQSYATTSWSGGSCPLDPNVTTLAGLYMRISELDKNDRDDYVGTLYYPTVNIPLECSNPWNCHGRSAWIPPNRGSTRIMTANIRIYLSRDGSVGTGR